MCARAYRSVTVAVAAVTVRITDGHRTHCILTIYLHASQRRNILHRVRAFSISDLN